MVSMALEADADVTEALRDVALVRHQRIPAEERSETREAIFPVRHRWPARCRRSVGAKLRHKLQIVGIGLAQQSFQIGVDRLL